MSTATAPATCVKCGFAIVDVSQPKCPNCTEFWNGVAPVATVATGGGAIVAPKSRWAFVPTLVIVILLVALAMSNGWVGFNNGTLQLGPQANEKVAPSVLYIAEWTVGSAEFRITDAIPSMFQCRQTSTEAWQEWELDAVKYNVALKAKNDEKLYLCGVVIKP